MDKRPPSTDNIEALLGGTVPTLDRKSGSGEYYLPPSHIQLLEQIEHLSRYSHFIQIVTGVSGSGKTTLLQQFYPGADDNSVHACCIQALPEMNAAALLAELCLKLNINNDSFNTTTASYQALIDHAELLKQLSRQLLIVIDDAENLALDAMELLFNKLSTLADDDVRPHIVLFAAPRIKQLTEAESLREVVETSCHFIEIPTLDREALDNLLAHCFSAVAARLDETQRQQVHTDSLGLPGRVARVLETISSGASTTQLAPPAAAQRSFKRLYLGFAALALCLILGAGLLLLLPKPLSYSESDTPVANASNRVRVELSIEPKAEPATATEHDTKAADLETSFEQRLAQARAALEAEQQPLEQSGTDENLATPPQPDSPDSTAPTQQLELAPIKAPEPPLMDAAVSEEVSPEQPPADTLVLKLPPAEVQQTELQSSLDSANAEQPDAASSYFGDGQTLLTWNPEGYTLQMLGARREESVMEFIASMPEPEKLLSFSTIYKDKPWYVVVYGSYADRNAAMSARGDLPPQLRSRNPWARSIKGMQDDIRRQDP